MSHKSKSNPSPGALASSQALSAARAALAADAAPGAEQAPAADPPSPYWNPYVAGVGLGLTLLISFVTLGAGLGASGGLARASAAAVHVAAPRAVESNAYMKEWFEGGSPLAYYLVFMGLGVFLGGLLSAWAARRIRPSVERGGRFSARGRIALALAGGLVVGFASRLAMGCTSGQALSGGALLLTGSWAFMLAVFAGAYAFAWFVRRQWQET